MADLLGEQVGETVGYRIRFEKRISAKTRIEVVTEGILTRLIQQDPELSGIGLIIFDEFHERNIHGDLALALSLDVGAGLRDDLRILVMSATLDTAALSRLLDQAPVIVGDGRSYPVAVQYLDRETEGTVVQQTARGIRKALQETVGDLLVFLPGVGEIKGVEALLTESLSPDILICPLYGNLSKQQQDQAIQPDAQGHRRIILATAIAETSLTIEGISTVVDAGWSRQPRFDPNSGLTRLVTVRVSLASADQRAGRAGRLGPGVCYRLWSRATQSQLQANIPPEIVEADLTPLVLELVQWGVTDPAQLNWLDRPPKGAYAQSLELLHYLGAIDQNNRITAAGSQMASLGIHPRLAHMLIVAKQSGQLERAADLAALLTEKDILVSSMGSPKSVDIEERLQLLNRWREAGGGRSTEQRIDTSACRQVVRTSQQLMRRAKAMTPDIAKMSRWSVGGLLAQAFPDRIAQCKNRQQGSYQMVLGRRTTLPEGDLLSGQDYLVVAHLDARKNEGRIFLAAVITLSEIREIESENIEKRDRIEWDRDAQMVAAYREERLGNLVLVESRLSSVDSDQQARVILDVIRQQGLGMLPWDQAADEFRARVDFLRRNQSNAGWPDLTDKALGETLDDWLTPWISGISRKDQLKRLNMQQVLASRLSWEQQQQLDKLAPSHFVVPSGSRKRIDYHQGDAPILAVRLQELFGSVDTPRICDGQVALVLHLLSPAQRPIQVTQDLKGFWSRTYPEVKKELKGRYPKHYWPDDPLVAAPTARAKPRKR
jgi:ATP-dependent helicase HrpB